MTDVIASIARWAYDEILKRIVTPAGGFGFVTEVGSGYSVTEEQMKNIARLQALCEEAVSNPAWIAHDITGDGKAETFCNRASRFIAEGMGYFGFRHDESANKMILKMSADPAWREEYDLDRVSLIAQKGALVFVCAVAEPNGHIVAAAPFPPEDSGSWSRKVPMVAQVGSATVGNGIKKLSAVYKLAAAPTLRAFVLEASIA